MKNMSKILIVCLVLLGVSGCGTLQRLVKDNGSSTQTFGGLLSQKAAPVSTADTVQTTAESSTVTLYFADSTGKNLVAEQRQIPKTLGLARASMNELLKGPGSTSGLLPVVADGTTLLDINIKNGTAVVDLSKEIEQALKQVSANLTVYAIVDTLTQFPTVKQVQLRVEGQPVNRIGSVYVTQVLTRNTNMLKKHPITDKPVSILDTTGNSINFATGG